MKNIINYVLSKKLSALAAIVAAMALAGGIAIAAEDNPKRLFDDNSLIRGGDGQVFVVRQGERVKVASLDDLRRNFRGREIVNVDDNTLAQIRVRTNNSGQGSINSGRGNARDNGLIRTRDGKIFEVIRGERRQIHDLAELRREHAGQAIRNVDDAALRRFPVTLEDNPNSLFDHNRLIRDARNRVFVVEDNTLRRVADLNELRREHLGQAIHNVNDDILLANGVKLRGDGTVDDSQPRHAGSIKGLDDFVSGIKLRGDGTVDDNLPRHSGLDNAVAGVNLRGDGTVDDNLPRNSGVDNALGSGRDDSSGGSSGRGGSGGSGGNSTDD